MKRFNKKLMSLIVASMYTLCLLLTVPVQANAMSMNSGTHVVAAYTKAQKAKVTKALTAALAKLPDSELAATQMTSAKLKPLIDAVNKQIALARKMKLSYTYYNNFERLDYTTSTYIALQVKEKAAADQATTDAVSAKAVSDMIKALPTTIIKEDEAKVVLARTAYMGLTINQMKLVTNYDVLVAAEKMMGAAKKATIATAEPYKVDSIRVTFTNMPDNYASVIFTVKRNGVPIVVTPSWADGRLEAILSTPMGMTDGGYEVSAKEGDTDLGSKIVLFEKQKVARIIITSPSYTMITTASGERRGYATYKVFDQYNQDITDSTMAATIVFRLGNNDVMEKRDGVLVIKLTDRMAAAGNVTVSGVDGTTGVQCTANLSVSVLPVAIKDFAFKKITNDNGTVPTAGDTKSVFYVTYKATDVNGNSVSDYKMLMDSLVLMNGNRLTVSTPMVRAEVVEDPEAAYKGAIKLTVVDDAAISTDMQVSVIAVLIGGKAATMTFTLKKGN